MTAGMVRFAPGVRLQWDEVRHQYMLVFPEGLLTLNPTAAEVLELCDGSRTKAAVIAELEARYPGQSIAKDVEQLMAAIAAKGLLVDAG
jgi:pyrroloquinoline quinone biosynthesis protein D